MPIRKYTSLSLLPQVSKVIDRLLYHGMMFTIFTYARHTTDYKMAYACTQKILVGAPVAVSVTKPDDQVLVSNHKDGT